MPYQPRPITIRPAGSSTAPVTNSTRCSSCAGLLRSGATPWPRLAAPGIAWGCAGSASDAGPDGTAGWICVVMSCLPEIGDAGLEAVGTDGAGPEQHVAGLPQVPPHAAREG